MAISIGIEHLRDETSEDISQVEENLEAALFEAYVDLEEAIEEMDKEDQLITSVENLEFIKETVEESGYSEELDKIIGQNLKMVGVDTTASKEEIVTSIEAIINNVCGEDEEESTEEGETSEEDLVVSAEGLWESLKTAVFGKPGFQKDAVDKIKNKTPIFTKVKEQASKRYAKLKELGAKLTGSAKTAYYAVVDFGKNMWKAPKATITGLYSKVNWKIAGKWTGIAAGAVALTVAVLAGLIALMNYLKRKKAQTDEVYNKVIGSENLEKKLGKSVKTYSVGDFVAVTSALSSAWKKLNAAVANNSKFGISKAEIATLSANIKAGGKKAGTFKGLGWDKAGLKKGHDAMAKLFASSSEIDSIGKRAVEIRSKMEAEIKAAASKEDLGGGEKASKEKIAELNSTIKAYKGLVKDAIKQTKKITTVWGSILGKLD